MKQFILGAALVGMGTVIGALSSDNTNWNSPLKVVHQLG